MVLKRLAWGFPEPRLPAYTGVPRSAFLVKGPSAHGAPAWWMGDRVRGFPRAFRPGRVHIAPFFIVQPYGSYVYKTFALPPLLM